MKAAGQSDIGCPFTSNQLTLTPPWVKARTGSSISMAVGQTLSLLHAIKGKGSATGDYVRASVKSFALCADCQFPLEVREDLGFQKGLVMKMFFFCTGCNSKNVFSYPNSSKPVNSKRLFLLPSWRLVLGVPGSTSYLLDPSLKGSLLYWSI